MDPKATTPERIKRYADALRYNIRELEKMGCKVSVTSTITGIPLHGFNFGYEKREHHVSITKEEEF